MLMINIFFRNKRNLQKKSLKIVGSCVKICPNGLQCPVKCDEEDSRRMQNEKRAGYGASRCGSVR